MNAALRDGTEMPAHDDRNGLPTAQRGIAFVTPYRMPTNAYIEMQKDLARAGGFEPRPFSVRHLLTQGGLLGLLRRRNIVLVQWLESRPFRPTEAGLRMSVRGSLLFAGYLALLALAPARVVYFVHDHAVHDTENRLRRLSQRLIRLMCRVADLRVVHDPSQCTRYQAQYLPHPLFWDWPNQPAPVALGSRPQQCDSPPAAPLRCAMLGAIRPYKAIDTILQAWPAGQPLLVAGRGSADLVARLRAIIEERGLTDTVTLVPGHQSDAAFHGHLLATDVLILPHAIDTALVSGAFFEAIGQVPRVLARRSPFIDWISSEFDNVLAFDDAADLARLLDGLCSAPPPAPELAAERARKAFGWLRCEQLWGRFFSESTRVTRAAEVVTH